MLDATKPRHCPAARRYGLVSLLGRKMEVVVGEREAHRHENFWSFSAALMVSS